MTGFEKGDSGSALCPVGAADITNYGLIIEPATSTLGTHLLDWRRRPRRTEQGVTQDLKAEEEAFFENVPFRTAATLNCIAVCRLHSLADVVKYPLDKTLVLLCQVLCILDKVLVLCCADMNTSRSVALEKAITVNNIGRALYQLDNFSGALSAYTEAYVLCKNILGNDHFDVAVSLYNVAEAQCCLGNAIKGYATSIAAEKLGSNHPAIASVLTTMGQFEVVL